MMIFVCVCVCVCVCVELPASGQLHAPLPVSYVVANRTQLVQEVEARISTSDAFMYSGKRHVCQ